MPVTGIDYEIPLDYFSLHTDGACPVFCLGDCILIEQFTGKSYTYKVFNLVTKEDKHLFHLQKPLSKAKHRDTAAKIAALGIFSFSGEKPPTTLLQRLLVKLRAVFSIILPQYGYVRREKQIELAGQMLAALHERRISISEAAVGTGKTHAYIIAAVLQKLSGGNEFWIRSTYPITRDFHSDTPMPIVISTTSIALQKAITETYIPEISKILMYCKLIDKPLSCVIRKGKEHYLCDERLREQLRGADRKTAAVLRPLMEKNYLRLDLDDVPGLYEYTKRKICVSNHCNSDCPRFKDCRFQQFLKHAQSPRHDFQVCNHNYLMADILRRKQGQKPLIPNYQAVIIDEAHNLHKVAEQMYGAYLSNRTLPALADTIRTLDLKDKRLRPIVSSYCDRLVKMNTELFGVLLDGVPERDEYEDDTEKFATVIGRIALRLVKSLLYCLEEITAKLNEPCVTQRHEGRYSFIMSQLKQLRDTAEAFQKPDNIVYWLEIPKLTRKVTNEMILSSIPKQLGQMLHQDLWSKSLPVILTSGTLSVGGSFEHIKKKTGLSYIKSDRLTETSKPSPFDFKKNCLLYISENVPFPDNKNPDYIRALAAEIEMLIKATHGHAAVLFTSYRVMERVYGIIKARNIGFPLFMLGRGKTGAIDKFRQSGNGVLFASGSMWEGIDLPGDILSLLIIAKLPFAVPDPVSQFEQSQYASADEYKNLVVFPEAALKLKQGCGRLIRKESDTGIIALLDYRLRLGGKYRKRILKALPPCGITSEIMDVEQFILHVKDDDYFIGG